uniref:Uncharacterized protein n=1 Tax=Arundo donax TaxID=35708 RepID=A0A0A9BYC9_ARUDO
MHDDNCAFSKFEYGHVRPFCSSNLRMFIPVFMVTRCLSCC